MGLIYDGECAYCCGLVRLVHSLDRRKEIVALRFESPEAQALLRAQLGDKHGFAMYFFEGDRVSWGAEAAKRVAESVALPRWMARLTFRIYPSLVEVISKSLRRRRTVCGSGCARGDRGSSGTRIAL
jgi:predicted DCC family thiol-disulfide oxidoreductase YuxK